MKPTHLLAAGLAAVLLASCSDPKGVAISAGETSSAAGKAQDVGVVLKSVRTADRIGGIYSDREPTEGAVLVLVDYAVTNQSTKPLAFADLPQIRLQDSAGVVYKADAAKTTAAALEAHRQAFRFDDLNPGLTLRKTAVFEVSKATFSPSTWYVTFADSDSKTRIADIKGGAAPKA